MVNCNISNYISDCTFAVLAQNIRVLGFWTRLHIVILETLVTGDRKLRIRHLWNKLPACKTRHLFKSGPLSSALWLHSTVCSAWFIPSGSFQSCWNNVRNADKNTDDWLSSRKNSSHKVCLVNIFVIFYFLAALI